MKIFCIIGIIIMINTTQIKAQEIKPVETKINESKTSDEVSITLMVAVPADTKQCDTIYITGDNEKLGKWAAKGMPLTRVKENLYKIKLTFKKGTKIEFKFNRGTWDTVEKDAEFYERPNRELEITEEATIELRVESWSDKGRPTKPTWVGIVETHCNFLATKLNNKRTIWVYLPPSYPKDKDKHYPVVYMQDGNNAFDRSTAFLGVEWGLDDTAERLIKEDKMKEIIIVGIENTPGRGDEYTHVPFLYHGGGKADLYADFLINEVKPFIDKKYRTLKDRKNTAIMGSSLGGLVSLYIAWKHFDVFSMAGVVSPSLWWANYDILRLIKNTTKKPCIKIWLDMGTLEGGDRVSKKINDRPIQDIRKLKDILIKKGFKLNTDFAYMEAVGARHDEASWAKRVDKILLFFFEKKSSLLPKLFKFILK